MVFISRWSLYKVMFRAGFTVFLPCPLQPAVNPEFSAAVWAYHFGYDNRGWPSMERASKFMEDTGRLTGLSGIKEKNTS